MDSQAGKESKEARACLSKLGKWLRCVHLADPVKGVYRTDLEGTWGELGGDDRSRG